MPQGMADRLRDAQLVLILKVPKIDQMPAKATHILSFHQIQEFPVFGQMRIACDTCGTGQPNYIALYTVLLSRLLGSQGPAEAESV